MAWDSLRRSSRSGTSACMRNASSNDSMAPSKRGSPAMSLQVAGVHRLNQIQLPALHFRKHGVVVQIADASFLGTASGIPQSRALVDRRQERVAEQLHATVAAHVRRDGDKCGKIPVLGAQPVSDPRADRRSHHLRRSGMQLPHGRGAWASAIGLHGSQHAQVVHMTAQVRQQVRDRQALTGPHAGTPRIGPISLE